MARLAARRDVRFRKARRFIRAEIAELTAVGSRLVLARPFTFMNEAGRAVTPLVKYYKVPLDSLLVVHDDIDLPFTKLRAQFGGGSGGNNGVKSIIGSLGTPDFWRLKLGVGRPPGQMDPADYVLKSFTAAEQDLAELMREQAADLVEVFAQSGGEVVRQRAGELNTMDER